MEKSKIKKVLIAIDPYEREVKPNASTIAEMKKGLKSLDAHVEAVYVFSKPQGEMDFEHHFQLAEKKLKAVARSLGLSRSSKTTVLIDEENSRRHAIQTLLKYVKKSKADLILLSSHGRKGVSRLVFGSFAEGLLADSPVPVLFVAPHAVKNTSPQKVIFMTDFSKESHRAFKTFLNQMAPLYSNLVIAHAIPPALSYVYNGVLGLGAYYPASYEKTHKVSLLKTGRQWLNEAQAQGMKATLQLDDRNLDPEIALQKLVDETHPGLVALACKGVGGIASHIFRSRERSTWVFGASAKL